jgi:prevent-host-death family protein
VTEISIRELRNHGGDMVDRVTHGERMTVTRDGRPVALLVPLEREPLSVDVLMERWSRLPAMDPESLRRDIDAVVDPLL